MIKKILKQIWASKRANGWIFIELLIIFMATWFVTDPLFTLFYQTKVFPFGFEPENVICMNIAVLPEESGKWRSEASSDEALAQDFATVLKLVRSYPGITAAAPVSSVFVYSASKHSTTFCNSADTTRRGVSVQLMKLFRESDYFKVFRFRDARTGRWDLLDSVPYVENGVFITTMVEKALFGAGKGVGQKLLSRYNVESEVVGVLEDFKGWADAQPMPVVIKVLPDYLNQEIGSLGELTQRGRCRILFRINEGVNKNLFLSGLKKELLPKLAVGNLYVSNLPSLNSLYQTRIYEEGLPVKMRLLVVLCAFLLINIGLAVFATFWLRVKKRRSEVGLRIAMGATGKGVRNYFVLESLLIYLLAAFTAILAILQILYFKGVYTYNDYGSIVSDEWYSWLFNNDFAHFGIVTLIVLVIVGGMVVLCTWLPASRAARIEPADALRAE